MSPVKPVLKSSGVFTAGWIRPVKRASSGNTGWVVVTTTSLSLEPAFTESTNSYAPELTMSMSLFSPLSMFQVFWKALTSIGVPSL
ncbi:hypothetical protein D9M72_529700 [compost metagenome]